MARGGAPASENGVRKKTRANSLGLKWWRKFDLPRRGKKRSLLVPTELPPVQNDQIKERINSLKKATQAPRAVRAKGMAEAEWDTTTKAAKIITSRGGCLQSMGEFVDGVQHIRPEEALYLVDRGVLDCCKDGLPMSVQHMWATAMDAGMSPEYYYVFSHLRRKGWVVRSVNQMRGGLRVHFAVWRVGGFRRKEEQRPLFFVAVYDLNDEAEQIEKMVSMLSELEKTRLKIAVVDRSVVILMDVASNASPLSERYVRRLAPERAEIARKLKNGDIAGLIGDIESEEDPNVITVDEKDYEIGIEWSANN